MHEAVTVTWNLDPPPGFQGLHPHESLEMYQRHLPHWRQAGATYFVTFRLADSIPQNKLEELKTYRTEWERRNPPPRSEKQWEELWRETFLRVDRWLDQGAGGCRLREAPVRKIVTDSLHYFDDERYELGSYVVMPNHVHLVVRAFDRDKEALERITHSWKRHTSREINMLLDLNGALWQDESFDRIVRDEEHLWRTLQYIGRNPGKVGITGESCSVWIRPSWEKLGWKFEGEIL
jgi:REP element-mobilizing transposase RayT